MPELKEDKIRELSLDELDAVAGGWPKWLEKLFGGGGSSPRTPGEMTEIAKRGWPPAAIGRITTKLEDTRGRPRRTRPTTIAVALGASCGQGDIRRNRPA
jgi:hypothetical protein